MKRGLIVLAALAAMLALVVGIVLWLNFLDEDTHPATTPTRDAAALIAQGAYLARAGSCAACHTARGGEPYAGGYGIVTPFGTMYSSNLTPDPETGIGTWTSDDLWRAMHNGRAKDGRFLYPAFPYPSYTKVTRADSDALFAYLQSLPAVKRPNRDHALRFPYNTQFMLAGWRALFFRPGVYETQADQSSEWNRGAYLVSGLGHCSACHASRNALGATEDALNGGLMPMEGWYAPSLHSASEASVAGWKTETIVTLLKHGVVPRASVMGPMAEVVYGSTQHLADDDLQAMATYLAALPVHEKSAKKVQPVDRNLYARGEEIYAKRCADCHGEQGEGVSKMYPALAGNRAVTIAPAVNTIRAVLSGGFTPETAGNPRPYGMPPFATLLNDEEIAAVVSYVRNAWGNEASGITAWEVSSHGRGTAAR